MKIKKIIQKIDFLEIRRPIRRWWKINTRKLGEKKVVEKGEKPEYFIIRRYQDDVGLFSYFNTTLGAIAEADKRGLIPVVDFQNYATPYHSPEEIGKKNFWEFYFLQPAGISLQEAYSGNYILSNGLAVYDFPGGKADLFYNVNGQLDYWRNLCKKYIKLNSDMEKKLDDATYKYLNGKGKILGVSCRGGGYTKLKPYGHPVQPTAEEVCEEIDKAMSKGKFDSVYLTVEDPDYLDVFRKYYGEERIIFFERDYSGYKDPMYYMNCKDDIKKKTGEEYLLAMLLLTKCNGLVTTIASGSVGSMCMSSHFDYLYVFDLGLY